MTEEDKEIEEFLNMFPSIPNPENYPTCFKWYVKLFKYYKSKEKNERLES